MASTRRYFLKSAGLSLFGAGLVPGFLRRTAYALEQPGPSARKKILVAIFQRGAADGLNIVVPFGEKDYFKMRPTIAIPAPSKASSAGATGIDLDGFFAFHPSLAALQPLFRAGHLAVVHAVGSPSNNRSHFDAQDYMETATPGVKSTSDGWLNRYMRIDPQAQATPFRAVAVASRMPRTLEGRAPALAIQNLSGFRFSPGPLAWRDPQAAALQERAVEEMYASTSDPMLASTAHEMFEAVATLKNLEAQNPGGDSAAQYPNGTLGKNLRQIAQLIKGDVGLEVAFAEMSGWDNHVNEGNVDGQLATKLKEFGDALAAFYQDLGDRMADVCVLTMTEFGRTARENGNRGTDHGHASFMFVLGGSVKGGKVYGQWPGLAPGQLNQDRDLALTTDFRDVFAEVLVRHLGADHTARIFPGFTVAPERFKGFLA